MADSFSGNLNLTLPEVGFANNTWGGTSGLNRDLTILDSLFQSNGLSTAGPIAGSGHPNAGVPGVGLRVGVGYILNIEGTIQIKDHTDVTKVAVLDSSLITTATTRTAKFPDQDGTLMMQADAQLLVPTGTVLSGYYGAVPPPGFVLADGRTIGDATSAATNRANADCLTLFTLFWSITANTQCPVLPGGRGASAAADWAAHKSLTLPDHRGRVMAGRDDLSGTSAGRLPNSSGTVRGAGSGAEKNNSGMMDGPHLLTTVEGNALTSPVQVGSALHIHNNGYVVQPTIIVDVIIKL